MNARSSGAASPGVTAVLPTFNRAHLLPQTIPTYLQPDVAELIVVDDASSDDTTEVVLRLAAAEPRIRYHRHRVNSGQIAALNTGIELCSGPLIYFGDDDMLLIEGSIAALLACREEHSADIAGCRHLYMLDGESVSEALQRTSRGEGVFDIQRLRTRFDTDPGRSVRLPFVMTSSLLPAELARRIGFDTAFTGSAYRGESDFLLRCAETGARIFFCPSAVSVNLPRAQSSGGLWSNSWWKYESSTIRNNWLFLKRHHEFLADEWGLKTPAWLLQADFIRGRASFRAREWAKALAGDELTGRIRKIRETPRAGTAA
ncbi:MAG: glycosyltransferase family 2 protein [Candidatus Geothermincolia bacterium]